MLCVRGRWRFQRLREVSPYRFVTAEDVAANAACHRQTVSHGRQLRFVVIGFHSLGDYEWMLAFEPPDVAEVVDLMRTMRYTKARRYVFEETPFLTGRMITDWLPEFVESLP